MAETWSHLGKSLFILSAYLKSEQGWLKNISGHPRRNSVGVANRGGCCSMHPERKPQLSETTKGIVGSHTHL